MNEGCLIDPALRSFQNILLLFFSLCLSVQLFSHDSAVSHFKSVGLKSLRNRSRDNTALYLLLEMLSVTGPLGTKTL